jgi:hypothetical protein
MDRHRLLIVLALAAIAFGVIVNLPDALEATAIFFGVKL